MEEQRILVGDTVQIRRNDRLTGVENRAQWIVRGIREEFVDLVSVGDSGELRRVSAEYARGHLQLAYASTAHGVQGDTADASVVGPDVDAAGLYVGLTRGRVHNIAIVVARTSRRARVSRRVDAARHTGADDAGCRARGSGGDAARGTGSGLGGDGDRARGRVAECWAWDGDVAAFDWRARSAQAFAPATRAGSGWGITGLRDISSPVLMEDRHSYGGRARTVLCAVTGDAEYAGLWGHDSCSIATFRVTGT